MYCIQCGAKLADTEKKCPLCGTVAFHPDIPRPNTPPLYPQENYPAPQVSPKGAMIIITTLFLIPFLITLLCDLHLNKAVTWSGYVMGALGVAYMVFVLPFWFRKPNPVIFVPCGFIALGLYLLYISLITHGGWFLSFAFPVTGFFGLLVTTIVTLLRYVRRGKLYIYGGALMAAGVFMPVMEFLMNITFDFPVIAWSIYPFVSLLLLGGLLIYLAISRHTREAVKRKFFI